MSNGLSISQDVFQLEASVPEGLVGLSTDGECGWAAWQGVSYAAVGGRNSVVLVSVTVAALHKEVQRKETGKTSDALAARLRAKHGDAAVAQFSCADGHPGLIVRQVVAQEVNGRAVTTGQAQALVAYPAAGALGVVSGVALDPADLDRAAALVVEIASGMTVTSAAAAALSKGVGRVPRRGRR
jgi:hypothetical protein